MNNIFKVVFVFLYFYMPFNLYSQELKFLISDYSLSNDSLSLRLKLTNNLKKSRCIWIPFEASYDIIYSSAKSLYKSDTLVYISSEKGYANTSEYLNIPEHSADIRSFNYLDISKKLKSNSSIDFVILFTNIDELPKVLVIPIMISSKKEESIEIFYANFSR